MLNAWKKVPNYLHGSFYLFIFAASNNKVQSLKSVYYVLVSIIPHSWMCYWICHCPLAHRSHWTYSRHYRTLILSIQKNQFWRILFLQIDNLSSLIIKCVRINKNSQIWDVTKPQQNWSIRLRKIVVSTLIQSEHWGLCVHQHWIQNYHI